MFGVGWPSAAPPPEYAPKSFHPVSSVISMTTFGRFCCCADAGMFIAANAATPTSRSRQNMRPVFIGFLHLELRNTGSQKKSFTLCEVGIAF
jgi:hypothetical protein